MDSNAVIAAGMLDAEGTSPDASAVQRAAALAAIDAGPTVWVRTKRSHGLDDYRQRVSRQIARWQAPTVPYPNAPEIDAFFSATRYDDLRFEVGSLADWKLVTTQRRLHAAVAAYVRRQAIANWQWRWPLRFAVLASPTSAHQVTDGQGLGRYSHLYSVFETDGSDDCELLFITPDRIGDSFPNAAVIVVLGVEPSDLPPGAQTAISTMGRAGIAFCPDTSLKWVERLVVELTHDSPLDLALAKTVPNAVLLADPEFVARATVRQWGMALATALRSHRDENAAAAVDDLLSGHYAREHDEATDTTRVSEVARKSGVDAAVEGGPSHTSAEPPSKPPSVNFETVAPDTPRNLAPPDDRRLQAIVRCVRAPGAPAEVTRQFVPGVEHTIQVRIAAGKVEGGVVADQTFESPTRGMSVQLDVSIIAGGKRTTRTLALPAIEDSKWTTAVAFTVPPGAAQFAVYIEVAYKRRVLQSATLIGTPFDLSVDVSEPAATVAVRAAAQGSITLMDGPLGTATVIDLDSDAGDVGEEQIGQATRALRTELLAAFQSPPSSLAEAGGPLTRLAVRGRILYDRLAGGAASYHDDDDWIHVNAFARSDVPIELSYTHPMPSSDTFVPVCPGALAGAASCGKDCDHRNDPDVVCPFGFWATSKVIERRRHVPGRTNGTPAAQRQVSPIRSSVVGVSLKADEVDGTSSTRIIQALGEAVTSAATVKSWQELETAAARHPCLFVLVTHTIEPEDGDDLATSLEFNGDVRAIHRISDAAINPGRQQPGPVVLALGCDTNALTAGYTDLVVNLHNARAEVVLSALSPIPGKGVADFLERFMPLLKVALAAPGQHRFGAVMLAARRATIAKGDLLALALSATGDADVELTA